MIRDALALALVVATFALGFLVWLWASWAILALIYPA